MQQGRPPGHCGTTQTLAPSSEETLASRELSLFRSETESKGPRDRSSDVSYPAQRKSPVRAPRSPTVRIASFSRQIPAFTLAQPAAAAGTNSLGVSGLETVMSPRALPLFPKRPFTPRRTLVPFREAWPLPSQPGMGGRLLPCQRRC